jgi:STAM-binding protein
LSVAPALPEKVQTSDGGASTPSSLDPASYTFKPSAYLENGSPLRSVFLPSSLRDRFLSLAAPSTRRNLETCGILCGTLVSNALFISRLVIPEQISTSDTCETTNESAIFEYCDSEDLIMLGWIHTHPSQTCFMSSRDLHTHSGYQVMLPESIAIVCAPSKNPDWGVFRLTDPPGLKTVLNCTQKGLFHPHAQENIYTGALRPGHVVEVNGLEYETVDLRPKDARD